jgi:hypothetical protein
MNPIVGDRDSVLLALQSTTNMFWRRRPVVQSVMNASFPEMTEEERTGLHLKIILELQEAYTQAFATPAEKEFYMPQIPVGPATNGNGRASRDEHYG